MSDETFEPHVDRTLDDLLDAAASAPYDEPAVAPGFADVLARVAGSPAEGERTRRLAVAGGEALPDPDRFLAELVTAARAEAAHDVASRGPAPGLPRRRTAVTGAVAVLAVAAAALLLLGIGRWSGMVRRGVGDETKEAAAAQLDRSAELRKAQASEPPAPQVSPRRRAPATVVPTRESTAPQVAPLEAVTPDVPEEPASLALTAPAPPHRPPRRSLKVRLDALDTQAQSQLAAGDTGAARDTLREIVALAGRRSVAQLAYGDLFTLAHRDGVPAQQRKLWREYLGRFPSGRFADDARAGLCRHASAGERQGCWTDYLRDFPRGAYGAQARRGLGRSEE
jgi:hypothetical protein